MIKNHLNKLSKKHASVFVLIGICIVVSYWYVSFYLKPSYLHEHMNILHTYVHDFYWVSVLSYMTCYTLATVFSIPGSSMFTIAGGLLFGVWPGVLYAVISATSGATILFFISRYVIGLKIQQQYADMLKDFNQELALYGYYYLLIVRLIALLPFFVVNVLSGLTLLPVKTYIWVTFVGLMPISLLYTYIGKQLGQLQSVDAFYGASLEAASLVFMVKVIFVPTLIKMYKRFRRMYVQKNV